jgi:hypothetical protein
MHITGRRKRVKSVALCATATEAICSRVTKARVIFKNWRILMRKLVAGVIAVCVLGVAVAENLVAKEHAGGKNIRVLIVTGGHGFDQTNFYKMFDGMKGVEYKKAAYPEAAEMLKPGLEKECDVVLMYDMIKSITPDQQKALVGLLNTGIGLVSLHHNLAAHEGWDEFVKIRGGAFFIKPGTFDGKEYPKSTWAEGQEVKVTIADKDHPITKGMQDFVIHDEVYGGCYVLPSEKVLLKTDNPKSNPELAWVHNYGKSRVFHLSLGHDSKAWANENFREILLRGIRWTADKE